MVFNIHASSSLISAVIIIKSIGLTLSQEDSFLRDDLFARPFEKFEILDATNKTLFTDAEKDEIMQIHNSYRSLVYPYATDMRELIWDSDLEEYAYNHTQACTGAHSNRSMVKKFRPEDPKTWETWNYMAENLYYSYAPGYSLRQALWMFWAEGQEYDIYTHNCTHKQTCGHYLALVLATSSRIGCAMNICKQFSISKYPTPAVFIACNYNGMLLSNTKPYTVGDQCSDCTRAKLGYEFQFCRHRLCVSPALLYKKSGFNGSTSVVGLEDLTPTEAPTTTSTTSTTTSTTEETTTSEIITEETTTPEPNVTTQETTTQEPSVTTGQTQETTKDSGNIKSTTTERSFNVAIRLNSCVPCISTLVLGLLLRSGVVRLL